jgi:peptidoglycan hydrolase-like protein with peptidoglycan-binding domain
MTPSPKRVTEPLSARFRGFATSNLYRSPRPCVSMGPTSLPATEAILATAATALTIQARAAPTARLHPRRPYLPPPAAHRAQLELKRLGHYNGAIDGIVGPETQSALRRFQQSQNLAQSGVLDNSTLSRLGIQP